MGAEAMRGLFGQDRDRARRYRSPDLRHHHAGFRLSIDREPDLRHVRHCNIGSFDVQAACSGFVYALTIAAQFIAAGTCRKIVVVGADKMSSIIGYADRATCVLFGDGAGAVLLEPSRKYGIIDTLIGSDGAGMPHLHQKAGGSRMPPTAETVAKRLHYVHQEGAAVYKVAVARMAEVATYANEAQSAQRRRLSIGWRRTKPTVGSSRRPPTALKLRAERVMINIDKYGNTTNATIPLCLWDYEAKLKAGDRMLLAAFGGGSHGRARI